MPNQANTARSLIALASLTAVLSGCAGESPHSGRRIIDDMERSHVGTPDAKGYPQARAPEPELPGSGPIALADLFAVAEARNPDLAVARSSVGVAAGRAWQASLYPNPRGDVSVEDVSWRDGFSRSKTTVGITQPFILGSRRHAAMNAADAEQAARLADVEARRRALFGDIAAGHARLIAIREQQRLYGDLRDLANRTLTAAQTRFEARAAPETDVIRPRVELYRIDAALGRLGHERVAATRQLELLLGGVVVDASRLEGAIPMMPSGLEMERLQQAVRATHPSLVVADREIETAAARLERVKAEQTPDLDARVAAGYRGESDDGIVEFGVGMTIPLWDTRQGDALSGRFDLMRARQQRAAIENDLLGRLAVAVGEYETAKAQLDTFRDNIVPDAQRAFDQTGEGYRAGRSSFLDLLDAQRTLTESRVTLTELASAVAAARAKVNQIVGPDGVSAPTETPVPAAAPKDPPISQERPKGAEVKP